MLKKPINKQFLRDTIGLACIALIVLLPGLFLQLVPGYMDAEYYFVGGVNLFRGFGFTENAIWNTLSLPGALPAASHLYWMPLPSVLANWGMQFFQSEQYLFSRFAFLMLSMLIPVITYHFTLSISQNRITSLTAGFMAVFSGVYLVYLSLVEAFSPYMILGGLVTFFAYRISTEPQKKNDKWLFVLIGILCGLMHLSRADGLLWIGFILLLLVFLAIKRRASKTIIFHGISILAGYGVVMLPWYWRNWILFKNIFPPGNRYTLFLTGYNDNFLFPPESITLQRWVASGWQNILQTRFQAIGTNLLTAWMIQFGILLLPFFIIWVYENRKSIFVRWLLLCYFVQFLFMSIPFPYAGMRGGFFHSGSAFQIVFWTGSAIGLFSAIRRLMERRHQTDQRIPLFLAGGVIIILMIATAFFYQQKVFGTGEDFQHWQRGYLDYVQLEAAMLEQGIPAHAAVLVNNPPGFYLVSQRPSVVVPNAAPEGVLKLANQYDISYLILDQHIVPELGDLYQGVRMYDGIHFLFSTGLFKVYSID